MLKDRSREDQRLNRNYLLKRVRLTGGRINYVMVSVGSRRKPTYVIIYHLFSFEDRFGEDLAHVFNFKNSLEDHVNFLEENSDVRASFELSGAEALDIKDRYPTLLKRLKNLSDKNQIDFVEGSFSEPHFHAIGPESNIRQFQYGLNTLNEIFGKDTELYFRQEASFHAQLPQILRGFGFVLACAPRLGHCLQTFHNVRLDFMGRYRYSGAKKFDSPTTSRNVLQPICRREIVNWVGLDGTKIPYVVTDPITIEEALQRELENEFREGVGLAWSAFYHCHDDICSAPPLEEIRDNMRRISFCKASDVVRDYLVDIQPQGEIEITTLTTYAEGYLGEAAQLAVRKAENKILQAEVISSMGKWLGKSPGRLDEAWRNILAAQHHDNWWIGNKRMAEASVTWSREAIDYCENTSATVVEELSREIDTRGFGKPILVINTLSWERRELVSVELCFGKPTARHLRVIDKDGKTVASDIIVEKKHEDGSIAVVQVAWEACVPQIGYTVYSVELTETQEMSHDTIEPLSKKMEIEEDDHEIVVRNPTIEAQFKKENPGLEYVKDLRTGDNIFEEDHKSKIGELHANVESDHRQKQFRSSQGKLALQKTIPWISIDLRGEELFGPFLQRFRVWPSTPRIDIESEVELNRLLNIGQFHKPETKLRIVFPYKLGGRLIYDIPFGVQEVYDDMSFYPTSWCGVAKGSRVGIITHSGTVSFMSRDQEIVNTLLTSNTRWSMNWLYLFVERDQRFTGRRVYNHSILLAKDIADAMRRSMEVNNPLLTFEMPVNCGRMPREASFITIEPNNVIASALVPEHDGLLLRLFESRGETVDAIIRTLGKVTYWEEDLRKQRITPALGGNEIRIRLAAQQIRNIRIIPNKLNSQ